MALRTLCLCPVLLSFSIAALCAGPITVHNQEIGFALTMPDGFQQLDADQLPGPTWVYAFRASKKISGIPEATITVERLGGVIERGPLDLATLRKGWERTARNARLMNLHAYSEQWKGFEIDAVRADQDTPAGRIVIRAAQVPLRREAVQVMVMGPASRDSQLGSLLKQVLQFLDGESNWLNDEERAAKLGEGIGRMGGWIIGLSIVIYLLRRSSRAKRAAGIPGRQG